MPGYYDETLEEIESLIRSGAYDDARFIIERELRMPYIPADFESKIRQLAKDVRDNIVKEKPVHEDTLETLLRKLKGNEKSQLAAASRLSERNLRNCMDSIKDYLSKDPCPEAAALLIEAIAEQEISDEFVYRHNGLTCEFYGDSVIPVYESKGFLEADACLKKWLENDNPSMLEMARTLLIHEVYMLLPLSYDEGEGEDLALRMLENVSNMIDEGETYRQVIKTAKQ